MNDEIRRIKVDSSPLLTFPSAPRPRRPARKQRAPGAPGAARPGAPPRAEGSPAATLWTRRSLSPYPAKTALTPHAHQDLLLQAGSSGTGPRPRGRVRRRTRPEHSAPASRGCGPPAHPPHLWTQGAAYPQGGGRHPLAEGGDRAGPGPRHRAQLSHIERSSKERCAKW